MKAILILLVCILSTDAFAAYSRKVTLDLFKEATIQGKAWSLDHVDLSVESVEDLDVLLITGAKEATIMPSAAANGVSQSFIYEAPTTSANGSAITIINKNRNFSAVLPVLTAFSGPTVTGVGTQLANGLILGEVDKFGEEITESGFVLKPNTKYLLRVDNTSGGTLPMSISVDFHE